jgi:hypothetical protein
MEGGEVLQPISHLITSLRECPSHSFTSINHKPDGAFFLVASLHLHPFFIGIDLALAHFEEKMNWIYSTAGEG